MDLDIVKAIQLLQNPVLDWFFYLVTMVGDRYVMIVLTAVLYWTVDRKLAFRFSVLYLISAGLNVFLKGVFTRPRPYFDEGVVVTGPYETMTEGYSFPSGHAQAAGVIGWFGMHGYEKTGKSVFKYVALFILFFVPLSRIYLGQHYLTDVLAGAILGYVFACLGYRVLLRIDRFEHVFGLAVVPFLLVAAFLQSDPDLVIALGGGMGFLIGYAFERVFLDRITDGSLVQQLTKTAIGLTGIVLLYTLFQEWTAGHVFLSSVRYFMIGMWASFGAPVVFAYAFKDN